MTKEKAYGKKINAKDSRFTLFLMMWKLVMRIKGGKVEETTTGMVGV